MPKQPQQRSLPALCALCALAFLALALARTSTWEPVHDDGVTFFQAIAPLDLSRYVEDPIPMAELNAMLDGQGDHSPTDVLWLLRHHGMHPPAYYLLLHFYVKTFGSGPFVLRVLAYALGLLSLLGVAALARRTLPRGSGHGPPPAFWAAALLATSPWFINMTVFLRPYGLAICLMLCTTVIAFDIASKRRRGWRPHVVFAALSALGIYSIYHYAFVFLWQLLGLAVAVAVPAEPESRSDRARWRQLAGIAGVVVGVGLLFAPWLPSFLDHLSVTGQNRWYFSKPYTPGEWWNRLVVTLSHFALGTTRDHAARFVPAVLAAALFVAAAVGLAVGGRRAPGAASPPLSRHRRRFWFLVPTLPMLIAAADLWHGTHTLVISKTLFGVYILLLLAVVWAGTSLPWRRLGVALLSAIVLFQASVDVSAAIRAGREVSAFEGVVAWLRAKRGSEQILALSSPIRGYAVPLMLQLKDAGLHSGLRVAAVPGDQLVDFAEAALADPSLARLTLVRFDVDYPDAAGWDDAALSGVGRLAVRAVWTVEGLDATAQDTPTAGEARILRFFDGARVRFFGH